MPFAFCQYTNDESAELAIKSGRGRLIKGRPCRCEKAKAHRLFFFERKYGAAITPDEVELLLQGFGRLTECRPATHLEMVTNNLGEGVVINFDMFDNGKNACQAFKNHALYRMISLFHLGSSRNDRNQSDPAHRAYLETYEIDRRSIFVGNLPPDISELDIKELFSRFGDIIHIAIHKNESTVDREYISADLIILDSDTLKACSKHCFAFIEFSHQPSVEKAILDLNGSILHGRTLRVNQKDSESARARPRRQVNRPQGPSSTLAYQSPTSTQQAPSNSPISCLSPSPICQPHFGGYSYAANGYPNSYFLDARGQCWVAPTTSTYSPSFPNASPFQPSIFQNSQYQTAPFYGFSSCPQGPQSYNWHQTPAPVWGPPNTATTIPPPLNLATYSPPAGNYSQDDRPCTPNQSSRTIVESSMKASA
ncbi:unnamed protein product [Blumeria hordei]|uniref:RRM domain-containing protein n=1 Tax=Blumeria hordei TaxID=2867405 RepID=A0A383V190_BLUHO|nr:unnamed protein product [Blumeria hordei]